MDIYSPCTRWMPCVSGWVNCLLLRGLGILLLGGDKDSQDRGHMMALTGREG